MRHKTLQLLQACRKEELPALRRFVDSPYFNTNKSLSALLDRLLEPPAEGLSPESIYQTVFPGTAFDDKHWRYLLSDLNGLIEKFWTLSDYENDPKRLLPDMLAVMSRRRQEKSFRQISRQIEDILNNSTEKDASYFELAYKYATHSYLHFTARKQRRLESSLQAVSDNLDRFYFMQKLPFACAMLENQHILQAQFDTGISAPWLQHLEDADFLGEPLIRLYHAALQAQSDEASERHFAQLLQQLNEQEERLPKDDLQSIYQLAINYCARKIRQGKSQYAITALELYTTGIDKKLFYDANHLSPWAFTNVVKLALRLMKYDWIESFIHTYAPALPEDFRQNAVHYNLAELYFYTNRFEKALTELHAVAMKDLNYYLGARVLLAKIYHETQETEALLSLLGAFTVFLKRNKEISANLKETYLNFCQLLLQINKKGAADRDALIKKISETPLLTDREWLVKQAR